jgi:hypothetical protein
MTLFEYVIAVAVGSLLTLTLVPISIYAFTSLARMANYAEMNTSSMAALDQLTTDIRSAMKVSSYTSNRLELLMPTGVEIRYDSPGGSGRLVRKIPGQPDRVLLTGGKNLTFSIYQRTPLPGTYDQYKGATNTETKVIAISWVNQRQLIGARWNQDPMYSAKVVMRCR